MTIIEATAIEYANHPLQTCVLDLIDQRADQDPNGIAADFQGNSLTYSELRDASITVALALKGRGFKSRDYIPLLTSMGPEMLVAVLGILRLGACYCPMDFNAWSSSRVLATLEAVQSKMVFSTVGTTIPGYDLVYMTDILRPDVLTTTVSERKVLEEIRKEMKQSDLIYIIFTSGTTGKPKGVMVSHGSAAHLVQQNFPGAMTVYPGTRVLLFFSVAFDGCAGVVFSTLCHGGTLAMALPADVLDVAPTCSTLVVTPSILSTFELSSRFDGVREIYMGGEAPTAALIDAWVTPTRKVYNSYGPTECTTAVSVAEMTPGGPIILGNIVSGVELVLLDDALENEVDEGEICIRGPCLAIGYLNNEKLTQEKFFMRSGTRHYRTGDLARRDKDGLHFLARVDRLVKNRGFLVNLETEVEPALRSFSGVNQAAAFMHQGALVGFITPADVATDKLQSHLRERYDNFLVPDLLFAVQDFPLTSNGKVDTKSLKKIVLLSDARTITDINNPNASNCATLPVVAEAFAAVFDRPVSRIMPTTSFVRLGGHSLRAIKLAAFLRQRKLKVSVADIFLLDTVSAIDQALVSVEDYPGLKPTDDTEIPLTDHQAEILRETSESPSSNYLFHSLTRDITSDSLRSETLRKAWELLFTRHSIFRTTFDLNLGTQKVHNSFTLNWTDIKVSSQEELKTVAESEQQRMLSRIRSHKGSPIHEPRFWAIELPGQRIQLSWTMHHVYLDAFSFGTILAELEVILRGEEDKLPPVVSLAGLAQFLRQKKAGNFPEIQQFWRHYARPWTKLKPLNLPLERAQSVSWSTWESDFVVRKMALDEFSRSCRVSSAMIIYMAWGLALSKYSTSNTVAMKASVSGRTLDYPSIDSIVGGVNGRCPLILQLNQDELIPDTLRSVQQNFHKVNNFQWTYPELRRAIGVEQYNSYWLESQVIILLDMPVEPGPWKVVEVQKPMAPLVLGVVQKGDGVSIRIQSDGKYSFQGVEQLGTAFVAALKALVGSTPNARVQDIVNVLG
ncbi:nonribosomal peptide synthetase 11 [Aspergillus pseudotamarii]|uniref:Nonribosomal peptide synthetase 11 n=1 Tax=Aspergillus pseudotamarii TaxID=132259 RepID=A0A5N6TBU1_ASPPS|nr:nonribosomal peptide synthetase 11 [Aspergillus pseudotamarii]KAE8143639.1 nonribosomal peptide synthetase 11 [Aspergillus pseudotamarii]